MIAKRHYLLVACCFIGMLGMIAGAVIYYLTSHAPYQPGPLTKETTFIIPQGQGFKATAKQLTEAGVLSEPYSFAAMAYLQEHMHRIKAGEYRFPPAITPAELLAMLVEGRVVIHKVTLPEGWNIAQIRAQLEQEPLLTGNVPETIQEGTLLPETYHYQRGEPRAAVVSHMQEKMQAVLHALWADRVDGLPITTPEEALILASIVEKETGVEEERRRVAAVYINRLHRGMPLQADPTVIYGIELVDGKPLGRPLLRKDLKRDVPHNTYMHPGLPPTPICNPGKASIAAVLNPLETDEIYFVATGDGGHLFAKTLAEHNRNVQKYRKKMREKKAR